MANLSLVWTKSFNTQEGKDNFESLLRNSTTVNTRLVDILKEMKQTNAKSLTTDYDSPSWAFKQADKNGYDRALTEILALFNYMEK